MSYLHVISYTFIMLCCLPACKRYTREPSEPSIHGGTTDFSVPVGDGLNPGLYNAVALLYDRQIACTGALIEDNLVVTAAHCFPKHKQLSRFELGFGLRLTPGSRFQFRPISEINQKYSPQSTKEALEVFPFEDLAVIRFQGPTFEGAKPLPLFLPNTPDAFFDGPAVLAGYGSLSSTGSGPLSTLQSAIIPITSYSDRGLAKGLIIAGDPEQAQTIGPCFGDSGGPLYLWTEESGWAIAATVHGVHPFFTPKFNQNPTRPCEAGQAIYLALADHAEFLNQFLKNLLKPHYQPLYASDPQSFATYCEEAWLDLPAKRTLLQLSQRVRAHDCTSLGEQLATLHALDLSSVPLYSLTGFRFLENLRVLHLKTVKASISSEIKHLHKLEELSLKDFSDSDLTFLSSLPDLKSLSIEGSTFNKEDIQGLQAIRNLTSLETLRLVNLGIKNLPPLSTLGELRFLELFGNNLRNLDFLTGNTALKRVVASRNKLEQINGLTSLPYLEEVILSRNFIEEIEPLAHMKFLKSLVLSQNRVPAELQICPVKEEYLGEICIF